MKLAGIFQLMKRIDIVETLLPLVDALHFPQG